MKESEFKTLVWEMAGEGSHGQQMAESLTRIAKLDLKAHFDPEEEPLPERLDVYQSSLTWWLAPIHRNWLSNAEKERGYREAARRYGLWDAVKKEAEDGLSHLNRVGGEATYTGTKFRNILSLMNDSRE